MWIFLSVLGVLALVITVILLLPVYIIIKIDENGELILRYKILHKTFGENPDPNNPILKTLKKASGISRLEKKNLQSSAESKGLSSTVSQTLRIVSDLLKEVVNLLKYCYAKKFYIKVVCAEEDAADTAISYGKCCAVVYPVAGLLSSIMKIRKRSQKIDISCDYTGGKDEFCLDFLISVRLYRVLAAFFRIAFKEAKRTVNEQTAANGKASVKKRKRKQKARINR